MQSYHVIPFREILSNIVTLHYTPGSIIAFVINFLIHNILEYSILKKM